MALGNRLWGSDTLFRRCSGHSLIQKVPRTWPCERNMVPIEDALELLLNDKCLAMAYRGFEILLPNHFG